MGHDSKFHDGLEREKKTYVCVCVCVCVHKKEHIRSYYIYEISPGARSKKQRKIVF